MAGAYDKLPAMRFVFKELGCDVVRAELLG
jgi:hypothetical protein